MRRVQAANPDVLLIDIPTDNPAPAMRAIELLRQELPDSAVFAIGSLSQPQVIVNAMRAGAREFIERPTTTTDLLEAFVRLTAAQRRVHKEGPRGKVFARCQEKWKRAEHPFDAYARLRAQAKAGAFPKPDDNFRWRYFGLFYVAPAQQSYMLRLRIPNGILSHWQFAGMADLAARYAGGYADVTTRANLQLREIAPAHATEIVEAVQDLGLCSRGAGADNIRNVTGSATAGIDPQELCDTRPLAREWHHHVLNDRSLYGLPRKFNVAFDGGGAIATLEETNDIGFQAVRIGEGRGVEPGLWFRIMVGGITGHRDLARDAGVYCRAESCASVADAIVRVFVESGDRTDRAKARLKYVLIPGASTNSSPRSRRGLAVR